MSQNENGNYHLPEYTLPSEGEIHLEKYALQRREYLKHHRKGTFTELLTTCKLNAHLMEVQQEAMERVETLIQEMAANEGVTEALKASDPMRWTGLMNNIKDRAEEIVREEIIFA